MQQFVDGHLKTPALDALERAIRLEGAVSREHKAIRKAKKRRSFGFTKCQKRRAMILYCKTGYTTHVSAQYLLELQNVSGRTGENVVSLQDLRRLVEDWFIAASAVEIHTFEHPQSEKDVNIFKQLDQRIAKSKLQDWVVAQNLEKGLAPTALDCCITFDMLMATSTTNAAAEPSSRQDVNKSRNRMFLWRWRKKASIQLGSIPGREDIPTAELTAKAITYNSKNGDNSWVGWNQSKWTALGALFSTIFWVQVLAVFGVQWFQNAGLILVPKKDAFSVPFCRLQVSSVHVSGNLVRGSFWSRNRSKTVPFLFFLLNFSRFWDPRKCVILGLQKRSKKCLGGTSRRQFLGNG